MKNPSESTAQTPKELLRDLHALVADAEKMMSASISEHTDDAVGALRARYEATQERLGELYSGARQKVVAGAKCTGEAIRENPYQAMAVALGIGLLAGVLLGRRSR
ncbi:MAG: DUF883 family protein [Opitutae bacterium]|nr:DUF883 family protein [Opitutae bacterium]